VPEPPFRFVSFRSAVPVPGFITCHLPVYCKHKHLDTKIFNYFRCENKSTVGLLSNQGNIVIVKTHFKQVHLGELNGLLRAGLKKYGDSTLLNYMQISPSKLSSQSTRDTGSKSLRYLKLYLAEKTKHLN